jgi:predicted transcriptional regulator
MTTEELLAKVGLKSLSRFRPRTVNGVFISDMVSDAMARAKSGDLWLTMQTYKSIIPAANLVDAAGIVVTGGKEVPEETVELATKYDIPLLWSALPTFELAVKLHALGIGAQ